MKETLTREILAASIAEKLGSNAATLRAMFEESIEKIGYFYIDDLLPVEWVQAVYEAFPSPCEMPVKKSWREFKYVAAQMNKYSPVLEEAIYAFQDKRVIDAVSAITQLTDLHPDERLYAGGLSLMGHGNFLNPHLDNSHDKERQRWRVLNLLFYVTPDWPEDQGGNLELWPNGVGGRAITIHSKFNRLAVMGTNAKSWHSVSPVEFMVRPRCCVSNYYFSDSMPRGSEGYHVTSFRGRPEQPIRDLFLRADNMLRQTIRQVTGERIFKNPHYYQREKN